MTISVINETTAVRVRSDRQAFRLILRAAGVALLFCACAQDALAQSNSVAIAIQQILAGGRTPGIDTSELDMPLLRTFYARRAYAPAWTGSVDAERNARLAQAILSHADEEGLDPSDYHAAELVLYKQPTSALDEAEHDIVLSDGVLHYSRDQRMGRPDIRSVDRDVLLPEASFDPPAALASALRSGSIEAILNGPVHPGYVALKAELARYRAMAAQGGWTSLPAVSAKDFARDADDQDALRKRLAIEDAHVSDAPADLDAAIKRFQTRHGLDVDGRIGAKTLQELNVSAADRIAEIAANMERWRWLPPRFESRYIAINAAAAELEVLAPDGIALTSRVIVGRPTNPTPILRAVATGVTVNPPWNVPVAIARKEILPKLKRNRAYLLSQDMILRNGPPSDPYGLHVDWHALRTMPYLVQQHPGAKNALGAIKLELPNRFDVYLHDTPAKTAFARTDRHLSHGCVRVEQILPLAAYALTGDTSNVSSLESAVSLGTTQYFPMSEPLPIYFLYWTAFVDPDGSVEFRPDIYGRDRRLIAALSSRAHGEHMTSAAAGCHVA